MPFAMGRFFDLANSIMLVLGPDAKVIDINPAGCNLLGAKRQEVVGKNWIRNFIPASRRRELTKVFDDVSTSSASVPTDYENPVLTMAGKERIILWRNTTQRDASGKLVAVLSSGTDVTDRKKAEMALVTEQKKLSP